MTGRAADPADAAHSASTREFDYGVGDELVEVAERASAAIASRIRGAAATDENATPAVLRAYEVAALLAEQHGLTGSPTESS